MINRQTFCLHLSRCGGIVTVVGMCDAEASGWRVSALDWIILYVPRWLHIYGISLRLVIYADETESFAGCGGGGRVRVYFCSTVTHFGPGNFAGKFLPLLPVLK